MRVVIASATYRHYDFSWALGMCDALRPAPDVAARFRAMDADIVPALAKGYGGGRQTGQLMHVALEAGADVVVTVESDMAWSADLLADLLESYLYLSGTERVAVGATYPASNRRDQFVLALEPGADLEGVIARIPVAAANLRSIPADMTRYERAAVLPAGFSAWPVQEFAGVEIVERSCPWTFEGWDMLASEHLRRRGVSLYYDLALEVGHGVTVPETAAELARRRAAGRA